MVEPKIIDDILSRGVSQIIDKEVLRKKLETHPEKVVIKYGVDPTRPDLHLGHAVCLRKLRQFQELGCKVIFLVGDFTAQIGDPSGKSKIRPEIQREELRENMKTYLDQVGKLLITDNEKVFSWITNSDWFVSIHDIEPTSPVDLNYEGKTLIKKLSPKDIFARAIAWRDTRMQKETVSHTSLINLFATLRKITHSQLIERDMFQERIKKDQPLFMHEMMYPVIQGIDSYHLHKIYGSCDLEFGGTDQHFNMLMGREVMKMNNVMPQAVMSMKIIEGLDGKEKMSKSLNNYIAVNESPNEMFGKTMSLPDTLLLKYFELCTDEDPKKIKKLCDKNPRDAKVYLAKLIIEFYHDKKSADSAEHDFITKFVKKEVPDDMPTFHVGKSEIGILELISTVCGFAKSNSDARRLVQQGAVTWDGEKIIDPNAVIQISGEHVLKAGKRSWAKIIQ